MVAPSIIWETKMTASSSRVSFSSFFLSALLHAIGIGVILAFPPTKSLILLKIKKNKENLVLETKKKVLDEISVIKIPKKNNSETFSEILQEDIGSISQNEDFIPHIDLVSNLNEKISLDFEVDATESFAMPVLDKVDSSYENYLSPLVAPFPEDLLEDLEPIAHNYQPYLKPSIEPIKPEPQLSEIDDLNLTSFAKAMPEMLDTELYTYKDALNEDYFKMELRLKEHKLFDELPQEFLFVLDFTQKGAKKNLGLFKEAIVNSVKQLKSQDKFNVIVINKYMTPLFPQARVCSQTNCEFLEDLFSENPKFEGKLKDLAGHLAHLFDQTEENTLHTHCLFFTEEPEQDKESLLKLAKYSHSKLSVYPILFNQNPKKPVTLHNLVEKMGGRLLAPPTKASCSRKFSSLISDIKKTRLRNVSVKVESANQSMDIALSEKTKALVLKKPLKVFGKLNGARTIKLQVLGSYGDDLFEMKKNLTIQDAKKGSSMIKEELELLD